MTFPRAATMKPLPRRASGTLSSMRPPRRVVALASLAGMACSVQKPYFAHDLIGSGARGCHVETLQADLKAWGYLDDAYSDIGVDEVDGIFGESTTAAVQGYQIDVGIDFDGLVGQETQAALCVDLELYGDPNPLYVCTATPPTGGGGGNGGGGNGGGSGDGSGSGSGGGLGSEQVLLYGAAAALGIGTVYLISKRQ